MDRKQAGIEDLKFTEDGRVKKLQGRDVQVDVVGEV